MNFPCVCLFSNGHLKVGSPADWQNIWPELAAPSNNAVRVEQL